jgi:hypothetical protein
VRSRQRRGELEPDNLAANDGRRMHDTSVRKAGERHKRSGACIASASRIVCPDEVRQTSRALSGRATARDLTRCRPKPTPANDTRNQDVNDPAGARGAALARLDRGRSRLGSVPALTPTVRGAAQNAAPFYARLTGANRCSGSRLLRARGALLHITMERSRDDHGVETGG